MSAAIESLQSAFASQSNVAAPRREAFAEFLARGLPTPKLDAWKYTDLRRFSLRKFGLPAAKETHDFDRSRLLELPGALHVVSVDGHASVLAPKPTGFSITAEPDVAKLGDAFELLNQAFAPETTVIEITRELDDRPLCITHIWSEAANGIMHHPRARIVVRRNARATLVEHHVGYNRDASFLNSRFEIHIEDGATLCHVRLHEDADPNFHIDSTRVRVARNASYRHFQYSLSGGLTRCNLDVELAGEGSEAELHGLLAARLTEHLDVRTVIHHLVPNARSREDYRGIADQRSRIVFNGKVVVAKDAQHTDAAQSSRNLLLSPQAEIDTRPELEIYANDVKCAHGATVGQLDEGALFYLQSRGVNRIDARAILTQAFAIELIERAPLVAIRERVAAQLMARVKLGELS